MALTLSSSHFHFLFLFITHSSLHCFSLQDSTSKPDHHENPYLKSYSKSNNNGDDSQKMLWCVAKNNAEDLALQTSLDWACGPGGANCGPIQQGGPCYDPSNFQATASFAFNDYFQKNNKSEPTCDFGNTAALTSLDPSYGNCKFPTSAQVVVNGGFTGTAQGMSSGPVTGDTSNGQIGGRWGGQDLVITIPLLLVVMML
ncbi:hypothetical protein MKW98_007627 [Papaver atlanticum]|uniref:X8 domain-containing protein n=1 Tax=Papaver atlanticum TaxID=357466 RepID=A0AAD4S3Q8_9MAGN|nr:hypothetical protein MKW98_007627 [Papaver atlanticum]